MGAQHSVAERAETTVLAVAVAIANQGPLARFLQALGYDVSTPGEVRHHEDLVLVFSVLLGVGVLMGLLTWFDCARAESYQAGVNAERVRRFREGEEDESSGSG